MMDERKDAWTHARTDGQTDGHGQRLMPFRILRIAGGIKISRLIKINKYGNRKVIINGLNELLFLINRL